MLISEVAAWSGPRRAGDNAPIAAAMAVAERVTAAAAPAAAAAWAGAYTRIFFGPTSALSVG